MNDEGMRSEEERVEETSHEEGVAAPDPYRSFKDDRLASWQGESSLERAEAERASYQGSLENMQRFAEDFRQRAEALRGEIAELRSGLVSRVLNFIRIRELESELGVTEHQASAAAGHAKEREEFVAMFDRLIREETELARASEEAERAALLLADAERDRALEDERGRDLSLLSAKHGAFFVHSIVESENRPSADNQVLDTKRLSMEDQFDILLGLAPTISVSTLDRGSQQETVFNRSWGVFLSGGRAIGGARADAFTKARGLRDRVIDDRFKSAEAIETAIADRDGDYYNELVVENPEVAGMYFKWDESETPLVEGEEIEMKGADADSWWKKAEEAMKRNVPVFLMTGANVARMAYDLDPTRRTFRVAAEMDPASMVDLPGIYRQHLGDDERKRAAMRVFDHVSGALSEEEREAYVPDGTEGRVDDSPYRLHP